MIQTQRNLKLIRMDVFIVHLHKELVQFTRKIDKKTLIFIYFEFKEIKPMSYLT